MENNKFQRLEQKYGRSRAQGGKQPGGMTLAPAVVRVAA